MIDYLRLSITDQCNLNCLYCTPQQRQESFRKEDVLSYDELFKVVQSAVDLGVKNVRLTGGEPLLRKGVLFFIHQLKSIRGLEEVSLTTNGVCLEEVASPLKKAGLDRVNISLDTLKEEKYILMTGADYFKKVWAGIEAAQAVGIAPVKINVVLIEGQNDDEIYDFVALCQRFPFIVRFIEYVPSNRRCGALSGCTMPNDKIKALIEARYGPMRKVEGVTGHGPAEYYAVKDSMGQLGFISGFSRNFCSHCNRIRVNSAGQMSPCLYSVDRYNLRAVLRQDGDPKILTAYMQSIFARKSRYNKETLSRCSVEMSRMGG